MAARERILDAARERFSRFGVRRTTMEEVSREAGLARATVYLHFPGKAALYRELLEADSEELLRNIEDAVEGSGGALEGIRQLFRVTLDHYRNNRVLWHALSEDPEFCLSEEARPLRGEHERRLIAVLENVIRRGIREGSIRHLRAADVAFVMFTAGRDIIDRALNEGDDYPFKSMMKTLSDVMAHGILIRTPSPKG
jgi:AcrR family transcriptional regulator